MTSDLIGRGGEADVLRRALQERRGAVVVGAPGVGKTALLAGVVSAIGPRARWGAGLDFCTEVPFLALQRALGERLAGDEARRRVVEACGGAVLVIDDAHWLDPSSVDLLRALASEICLVLGLRPSGPSADDVFALARQAGLVEVALGPLAEPDAVELVGRWAPHLGTHARTELCHWGGSVPGLCRVAVDLGPRVTPDLVAELSPLIAPLSVLARRQLAAGSVLEQLPVHAAGVRELMVAGLVRDEQRLPREGPPSGLVPPIAGGLGSTDSHGANAGGVTPLAPMLCEAAMAFGDEHERQAVLRWAAGECPDPGRVGELLLAAGELEAARQVASSVPEPSSPQERDRLAVLAARSDPLGADRTKLRAAAVAARQRSDLEALRWVAEVASRHSDQIRPGELELLEAQCAAMADDPASVLQHATAGLERTTDPAVLAPLLATRAMAHAAQLAPAEAVIDARAALDLVEPVGSVPPDGLVVAAARSLLAGTSFLLGLDGWEPALRDALESARSTGVEDLERTVADTLAFALFWDGQRDSALAVLDDAEARCRLHRRRDSIRLLRATRATNLALCDLSPPDVVAELQWLHDDVALTSNRAGPSALLVIALTDHGRYDDAGRVLAEAAARQWTDHDQQSMAWAAAELALARHEVDGLSRAVAEALAGPVGRPAHAACAVLDARRRVLTGERPAQRPIVVPAAAWAGLPIEWDALAARLAGDLAGAFDLFGRAAAAHDVYFRRAGLRCRLDQVEVALATGDQASAADLAAEVIRTADTAGLGPVGNRARGLLRRAGGKVRAPVPSAATAVDGRLALTARQLEVVTLVGDGLSSREIAARLGISPATVDSHLRSAMRRLGVSSRTAAAAQVGGHGPGRRG